VRQIAAVKLFFVIAICTIYLISFSQIGVLAYETFFKETDRLPAGTMVGPISVANKSKQEALQAIEKKVNEWKANATIPVAYQEKKGEIPASLFTFQIEQSVRQMVAGRSSPLLVQFDVQAFSKTMEKLLPPPLASSINLKKLQNDVTNIAASLQIPSQPIDLAAYVFRSNETMQPVSAATLKFWRRPAPLLEWISANPTIEVKGKSVFSLAAYVKETSGLLSSEEMSMIASAIYQTILPTNFTVLERHTSRELPDGITIGYEAKVDGRNRDLQFYNPNTTAYTLKFRIEKNRLHVTLFGLPFAYRYVVKVGDIEYFKPRTVVQYSPLLRPGERQLKQSGKRGMLVKVKRETYDENHLVHVETIAEDFYPPSYNIELHGLELGDSNSDANETPSSSEQPTEDEKQTNEQPKEKQDENNGQSEEKQAENETPPTTNDSSDQQKGHDQEK
jgi:VanW like protein/G5 domain